MFLFGTIYWCAAACLLLLLNTSNAANPQFKARDAAPPQTLAIQPRCRAVSSSPFLCFRVPPKHACGVALFIG